MTDTRTSAALADALRVVYIVDAAGVRDWERLDAAIAGGMTATWLRAPDESGADLYRAARALVERCRPNGVAVIVGDRADVALAAGADGVQIGYRSPPAKRIRPFFPGWIGVSCHTAGELASAVRANADYAVLSPVFGVPSKGAPLGPVRFEQLRLGVPIPVVALGGIETTNARDVFVAGASGVAVIRALRDALDPRASARALRSASGAPAE